MRVRPIRIASASNGPRRPRPRGRRRRCRWTRVTPSGAQRRKRKRRRSVVPQQHGPPNANAHRVAAAVNVAVAEAPPPHRRTIPRASLEQTANLQGKRRRNGLISRRRGSLVVNRQRGNTICLHGRSVDMYMRSDYIESCLCDRLVRRYNSSLYSSPSSVALRTASISAGVAERAQRKPMFNVPLSGVEGNRATVR